MYKLQAAQRADVPVTFSWREPQPEAMLGNLRWKEINQIKEVICSTRVAVDSSYLADSSMSK